MAKYNKDELVKRLNRIKGQVEGILRMTQRPKTTLDIFNQISAAKRALDSTGRFLLEDYIQENISSVSKSKEEGDKIKEILEIIERF